jgi:hypothetical protein
MAYAKKHKPTSILLKAIFENGAAPVRLLDAEILADLARRLDEAAPQYSGPVVIDATFSVVDVPHQG